MVMKKEVLSKLPVSTKQQRIAEIARRKRGEPLTLLNHYIDEKWLYVAYAHLRKESAPGVDGQTVLEYGEKLESNVKSLLKLGFESKKEAEKVLEALTRRFERYGLELHQEKTRLVYFGNPGKHTEHTEKDSDKEDDEGNKKGPEGRSFDFLGFTHYWGKSLKGKWVVKRKTSGKKFREKKKMNEWCREYRHFPIDYQYQELCQKLKGHYAYYGITGNMLGMQRYLDNVKRIWKKWLCRRSWKTKLNWEKFNIFLTQRCPLPPVKVVHSIYAKRAAKQ